MSDKIRIYLAQRMTGLYCDELLHTATQAKKQLELAGFEVLSPVISEGVPDTHTVLINNMDKLLDYWKRDKKDLQDCHLMIDLNSQGLSDGVNVESGYCRFFMFKPLVRIHPTLGCVISKIEYDCVFPELSLAIPYIKERWGTKNKLFWWRIRMFFKSLPKLIYLHVKFFWEVL